MDVRCEKCSTVYEFDESRVGEQGVTVKCTQCGNLFKVKRRGQTQETAMGAAAARSPAYIPPAKTPEPPPMQSRPPTPTPPPTAPQRTTAPGIPVLGKPPAPRPNSGAGFAPTLPDSGPNRMQAPPAQQHAPAPQQHAPTPHAPTPTPSGGWMIRVAATGDVYRFRELTTLQQWIVERKVTREDEISRGGEAWKRLGGIAELASFFHVVEQAEAVARADGPRAAAAAANAAYQQRGVAEPSEPGDDMQAPMGMPSGPTSLGNPLHINEPAFARNNSSRVTVLPEEPLDDDDDFDRPRRRRGGLIAGLFAAGVLVAGGGYLVAFKRDAIRGLFSHGSARAEEAYRQGREFYLLDSDDNFRQALAAFDRAHQENDKGALPLAGIAETKATWAGYLKDDAKALEATASPSALAAAKTLRREAQVDLDDAKRAATEALDLEPDAPEVNRAMAAYLLVDGANAAEVNRYLDRATAKRAADAESAYVAGAVAFRDGHSDDAKGKLIQANALNQAATQHALLRASYLLARIAVATNDKAGAKTALQAVLAANAQHDRARALLATIEPPGAPANPASGATPTGTPSPVPPPPASGATVAAADRASDKAAPPGGASAKPEAAEEHAGGGGSYASLVAQGDRLSENGRAVQARKLYDKALALQPNGIEATLGLGYCDLDGEKFGSAVDHFKQVLGTSPGNGEAIIGIAEANKLRGDKSQAVEWYKKYLATLPNGPKAAMARNNIRDLAPQKTEIEQTAVPAPSSDTPKTDAPKADEKPAPSTPTALPRPPTNDEPPP